MAILTFWGRKVIFLAFSELVSKACLYRQYAKLSTQIHLSVLRNTPSVGQYANTYQSFWPGRPWRHLLGAPNTTYLTKYPYCGTVCRYTSVYLARETLAPPTGISQHYISDQRTASHCPTKYPSVGQYADIHQSIWPGRPWRHLLGAPTTTHLTKYPSVGQYADIHQSM